LLLKVAECRKVKFSVSRTTPMIFGFSGAEMPNSAPSPMQAPAARSLPGWAVMSWQPVVG